MAVCLLLPMLSPRCMKDMQPETAEGANAMTRRSISTVFGSLIVGLLIAVNASAVSADAPCLLDNEGNCVATSQYYDDLMSQQDAFIQQIATTGDPNSATRGYKFTESNTTMLPS